MPEKEHDYMAHGTGRAGARVPSAHGFSCTALWELCLLHTGHCHHSGLPTYTFYISDTAR
jgi:hypothetical protein